MPKKLTAFGLVIVSVNLFIIGALAIDAPSNIVNTFFGVDALLVIVERLVK